MEATNSSSALEGSHPWLASWTADGGNETRLHQLGLCCFWVVHGLLMLALTTLTLRRCLCPHPLHLIYSAGVEGYPSAAEGNISAGIADSVAVLIAGAIVSGALPPRARITTEPSLSFLEQNVAVVITTACLVACVVVFSVLLNMIHFEGKSVEAFVTEKVQARYRLSLGGPILGGTNLKSGNPVKAVLYGGCLVSYSLIMGKAAATSVELLHLAVWAGAGFVVLLLVGAVLAKQVSSGFSTKHSFKKMAEKHNWGYGLVVGATVLALGLAVTGLIPGRGCGVATARAPVDVSQAQLNRTATGNPLFELPSDLAVLAKDSLQTEQAAAVLTPDSSVALLLALLCVMTTRSFYQLPLRCVSGALAKKKRKGKKPKGRSELCSFRAALQVADGVTSGSLHAVSISFAGYTVAMGNVLAATLGPAASVSPLGPRLRAALQHVPEALSSNGTVVVSADAGTKSFALDWQNVSSLLAALWTTVMPQLAWTGVSCVMMVVAHHVHLTVISWHLPGKLDSEEDSEEDDDVDYGCTGVQVRAIERLRNNDCAYGVMEGGMYIVSSFVIAAGCAGRELTARDIAASWLGFAACEVMVCIFGAVTACRERGRRGASALDSDDEGSCCSWGTRSGKRSKTERREAKRRRELMLKAARAPGPGQTVGQSLNWCLHLIAWVLLLLGAYRSTRANCAADVEFPLLPTLSEVLPACVWAVLGSAVLASSQRIVMELVLSDVSDAYCAELERDPQIESVENWGPGLVGGTVSVGISIVLVGLLPPPACA